MNTAKATYDSATQTQKAQKLLNFKSTISLENGLTELAKWAKTHLWGDTDLFEKYFLQTIAHNRKPSPDAEEGLKVLMVVEKAYKSAQSGKAIDLDL